MPNKGTIGEAREGEKNLILIAFESRCMNHYGKYLLAANGESEDDGAAIEEVSAEGNGITVYPSENYD